MFMQWMENYLDADIYTHESDFFLPLHVIFKHIPVWNLKKKTFNWTQWSLFFFPKTSNYYDDETNALFRIIYDEKRYISCQKQCTDFFYDQPKLCYTYSHSDSCCKNNIAVITFNDNGCSFCFCASDPVYAYTDFGLLNKKIWIHAQKKNKMKLNVKQIYKKKWQWKVMVWI